MRPLDSTLSFSIVVSRFCLNCPVNDFIALVFVSNSATAAVRSLPVSSRGACAHTLPQTATNNINKPKPFLLILETINLKLETIS
jgi:hypothetical protein